MKPFFSLGSSAAGCLTLYVQEPGGCEMRKIATFELAAREIALRVVEALNGSTPDWPEA